MDPVKQVVTSKPAKGVKEKDLGMYDLFPIYPTGKPSFLRFLLRVSFTNFDQ